MKNWNPIEKSFLFSSFTLLWISINWVSARYETYWFQPLTTNLSLPFGSDSIAHSFALLSALLVSISLVISQYRLQVNGVQVKEGSLVKAIQDFCTLLISLEILLLASFYTTSILFFYIGFESTLLPMFILVGKWGSRKQRTEASFYLFLFTLAGSLLLLVGLIGLVVLTGSPFYPYLETLELKLTVQLILWWLWTIGFGVKLPLFGAHHWLPKAHVEAPMAGSVMLAGVLLKLGGYGILRYVVGLLPHATMLFNPVLNLISILGLIWGSWATARQIDLKRLIAYSSVAHMGILTLGLISLKVDGLEGGWILMIGHGITSPALFILVSLIYWRVGSRNILDVGGLVTILPLLCTALNIFNMGNLGLPATVNFTGEFLILASRTKSNLAIGFIATTTMIWSAIYSLKLYERISNGTLKFPSNNKITR